MIETHGSIARLAACAVASGLFASAATGQARTAAPWDSNAARAPGTSQTITWCASPVKDASWVRSSYYLVLREADPVAEVERTVEDDAVSDVRPIDSAIVTADSVVLARRLARPIVGTLLQAITVRFRRETQLGFSDSVTPTSRAALPSAELRYGPRSLDGYVRFDLLGSGMLDSLAYVGVRDSVLANDIAAALRASEAGGDLVYGAASTRHRFMLYADSAPDSDGASWPAFTLRVPESREARPLHMVDPHYPMVLRTARVTLAFVIDTAGRVVPGSIYASRLPADSDSSADEDRRQEYQKFVQATRAALLRSRFVPAVVRGCRVRQLELQPYAFVAPAGFPQIP